MVHMCVHSVVYVFSPFQIRIQKAVIMLNDMIPGH